jgi:hypothetical protein
MIAPLVAVGTGIPLITPEPARAQQRWTFEVSGGSAFHVPTPLKIHQRGEPDIELSARYDTRPWSDAPYYALRVGRWIGARGWELELIHHKLYLRNEPP